MLVALHATPRPLLHQLRLLTYSAVLQDSVDVPLLLSVTKGGGCLLVMPVAYLLSFRLLIRRVCALPLCFSLIACQAMSHESSPSPSRTFTKEREYGTRPRSCRSGPTSNDCSRLGAPRFTTPLEQVDYEPPVSEDAKLEAETARVQQDGSSSGYEQRQQGSSPHGERRQEDS